MYSWKKVKNMQVMLPSNTIHALTLANQCMTGWLLYLIRDCFPANWLQLLFGCFYQSWRTIAAWGSKRNQLRSNYVVGLLSIWIRPTQLYWGTLLHCIHPEWSYLNPGNTCTKQVGTAVHMWINLMSILQQTWKFLFPEPGVSLVLPLPPKSTICTFSRYHFELK